MTAQHTPGPWECKPSDEYSWTYEIEPHGRRDSDKWKEAEANASLIAAAPDLLAALQAAVALSDKSKREMDERAGFDVGRTPEMQAVYNQCTAAIQKATKEQA